MSENVPKDAEKEMERQLRDGGLSIEELLEIGGAASSYVLPFEPMSASGDQKEIKAHEEDPTEEVEVERDDHVASDEPGETIFDWKPHKRWGDSQGG